MSYSNFTNLELKNKFGVTQEFREGLFADVPPRSVSDLLRQTLAANLTFALAQGSEKARSEFIIAPVLSELRRQTEARISIFSGVEFNVDAAQGLSGFCDFLISRSPYQSALEAPIVVAVEAKRQDFERGISQCTAEMIAAQIYNERTGQPCPTIYGCVTTGDVWRFLRLREKLAEVAAEIYKIQEIEKIIGLLWAMTIEASA